MRFLRVIKNKCLTYAQSFDNMLNMLVFNKKENKSAFTLAEVLITLGIIGIVSALVLPAVITNVNKKAWSEAQYIVRRKMQEAANQMKTAERLHGYSTTEDFVKEFKKHIKLVQVCDNTKLKDCYAPKVVITAEKEIPVTDLQTSSDLGQSAFNTNTMGLVTADGTTVILAYDKKCPFIEPTNNTTDTLSCMSMIYDINGKRKPNKLGEDITAINASISPCDMKIGNICTTAGDLSYTPINTCAEGSGDPNFTQEKIDIIWGKGSTDCQTNYWYGAKKACEEHGMRLPTREELNDLWLTVKNNPSQYGFISGNYWTSEEYSSSLVRAHVQNFGDGSQTVNLKYGARYVRCVK